MLRNTHRDSTRDISFLDSLSGIPGEQSRRDHPVWPRTISYSFSFEMMRALDSATVRCVIRAEQYSISNFYIWATPMYFYVITSDIFGICPIAPGSNKKKCSL